MKVTATGGVILRDSGHCFTALPLLLAHYLKEFLLPSVLALCPRSIAVLTQLVAGSHHEYIQGAG